MNETPAEYQATIYAFNHEEKVVPVHFDTRMPWSGWVPIDNVIANPNQPRKYFNPERILQLGKSLSYGQSNPTTVILHTDLSNPAIQWMADDGERRLRALKAIEMNKIWVCYNPLTNSGNLHASSFRANFCKESHTHKEAAIAVDKERKKGKTYREIGEMVGQNGTWAQNTHNLLLLAPSLLDLMDEPTPKQDRLPALIARLLWDYRHEDQVNLWEGSKKNTHSKADAFRWIEVKRRSLTQCSRNFGPTNHEVAINNHHATPVAPNATSELRSRTVSLATLSDKVALASYKSKKGNKPSDDKKLVNNKVIRCLQEVKFLNGQIWADRINAIFPGQDISVLETSLDELVKNIQELKSKLQTASRKASE